MARQFNGTSDAAATAATIDLTATNVVTLAMWAWWDAFVNDYDVLAEFSPRVDLNVGAFGILPNDGDGTFHSYLNGNVGLAEARFTRPSAAAWHHYVFEMDMSRASAENGPIHVDGTSQTLTRPNDANNTANFGNHVLYLASREGNSLFGACRLAAVGLWSRALSSGEKTDLAGGAPPSGITSGLVDSWRMSTAGATETGTNGRVLNYTGTTVVADPPTLRPDEVELVGAVHI